MAEPFDFGEDIEQLLESVADADRGAAATCVLAAAAAQLTMLIGARSAAAVIYRIADLAATQHMAAERTR